MKALYIRKTRYGWELTVYRDPFGLDGVDRVHYISYTLRNAERKFRIDHGYTGKHFDKIFL